MPGSNPEDDANLYRQVTIEAFGHTFVNLLPGNAEDLRTLEKEGAVYSEFADHDERGKFLGTFTRYKIQLKPNEIFEYVEANIAQQQFFEMLKKTDDFTAAVMAISDEKYRKRVTEYGEYGTRTTTDGFTYDNRGCTASFVGVELESLLCGGEPDRYEATPELGTEANQDELTLGALKSIAVAARKLSTRGNGRPALTVANEYDVQDLAETVLRAIFTDVVREEWTPKRAGSAKRIDLAIPSTGTVIECKFVRNTRHARTLADELRIDFECYHDYEGCRQIYAYIYDPDNLIPDPEQFSRDLDGIRRKKDHEFVVSVIVGK